MPMVSSPSAVFASRWQVGLERVLTSAMTPGVQQVLVSMDWRGLAGRALMWDHGGDFAAPGRAGDDRFLKTVALPSVDLRDGYFDSFRRVALAGGSGIFRIRPSASRRRRPHAAAAARTEGAA
jgi:hypothetical protein